jgi:tRNA-specific 2-thiouridylase
LKLWGGAQDAGCCSVGDVDDARRVAQQLGITHHVFNFTAEFAADVVDRYVGAHVAGRTPNPCIECNRHIKFDRLLTRARRLGFDALATGHHARIERNASTFVLRRGYDRAKDQSYVLYMLGQQELARVVLPVGTFTKEAVRAKAAALGLRTAAKPDSQDTCFITSEGRHRFLARRAPLHPGRLVGLDGTEIGTVDAVELVTVGQRRGLRGGGGRRHYALQVDVPSATVTVGPVEALATERVAVESWTWTGERLAPGASVLAQCSAHGRPVSAMWDGDGLCFEVPQRRIAPGQAVVAYDALSGTAVLGGGCAA